MRFRDDIVRGLRLGAILLTLFIVAVAGYRVVKEHPASAAVTTSEEAKPATPPTRAPDPRFLDGPAVPPPPPGVAARKTTVRRPAPVVAVPVEVESHPLETPPASESIVREVASPQPPPTTPPVQEQVVDAPAPVAPPVKTEARPKRWARAVGRFLHIVHPPPEN